MEIDPACTAARVELAETEFHAGRYERSLESAAQVEEIDRGLLRRRGVQWWTDRSTRPLLRAFFGMMLCQWHLGRAGEAAETGQRLLETDAADHMGARFYVPLFISWRASTRRPRCFSAIMPRVIRATCPMLG